jgi:sugar phosphate isomerase/epimerase
MTDRRAFIKKVALAAAGASVLGSAAASPVQKRLNNVGIITGTLKNEMKEDYKATLKAIADMGYTCIEGGVPAETSPTAYRKFLKDLGLRPIATGASMGPLQKELNKYLKTAQELKAEYVVCYYPWLTSADNLTTKEVMEAANNINAIGRKVKEAGFRFAWHNHAKEFVPVDGELAFDTLMKNTDPAYSTVQLDWYWVVKGGRTRPPISGSTPAALSWPTSRT